MLVTEKTPNILFSLLKTYKEANENGNAYRLTKACIFHNNEPVNIFTAVILLKDVKCLVSIEWCHAVNFEYCLRYFSEVTGYSTIELNERVNI